MATVVAARVDQSSIWWVFLLEGIAALIFGALLLTDPAATLLALSVFLGFYLLFIGVLELVRIFVDRSQPWYWSLIVGILGIIAGVVVLNHPVLTAVALPTTVVIYLGVLSLVMGVAGIIGGFSGGVLLETSGKTPPQIVPDHPGQAEIDEDVVLPEG
jgi:uncharacterized membrane protein HdeD (DUF308 family)